MKNIKYNILLIVSLLLMSMQGLAQQSFFYYYQNQETALEVCTEKVLVKFSEEMSLGQKQRILAQNRFLEPKFMKPMAGVDIVSVHSGVSQENLLLSLREMSAHASIAYVHPFFWVDGTEKPLTYRDDILVQLAPGVSQQDLQALGDQHNFRVGKSLIEEYRIYQLHVEPGTDALAMANRLHILPAFSFAEPNFFGEHAGTYVPNDPELSNQYSIANNGLIPAVGGTSGADMRVDKAWDITTGCSHIVIGILDDGIDLNHPDLMPNLVTGYDALLVGGQGMRFPGDTHGTACAGTAAAKGDNGIGVAGVAYDCSIMPIRVFSDTFGASSVGYFLGFLHAAQNDVDVLSNSWTWSQSNTIDLGISLAAVFGRNGKGCIILASSGNTNRTTVGYPARHPDVIAVGAGNQCDERKRSHSNQTWVSDTLNCSFNATADPQGVSCDLDSCWGSSYGLDMELLAPGIMVRTTFENNGYGWFLGTSAACPNAAGVAALILSVDQELTGAEVEEILLSTARKPLGYSYINFPFFFPHGTWNPEVGYGIPHAEDAVKAANTHSVVYIQKETFTSPPLADIRQSKVLLLAGRNVTNTKPQGDVNILAPTAPLTFFQAGQRIVLKPGFKAGQNTFFDAKIVQIQCPVKL